MSKKSNKARAFNSRMHFINEDWAAEALGMQRNPETGVDLLGDRADVEAKFCLQDSGGYIHLS